MEPSKGILFGIVLAITTPQGAIANLHLLDFFVVAVPLVHTGYLFLSTLGVSSIRTNPLLSRNNARIFVPAALVAIFIICIVQAALLFFLGNTIAQNNRPNNSTTDDDTTDEKERLLQSTSAFVSWLTFATIMATAGSMLVKYLIVRDRIPIEWILLYAFTIGFLITVSLTIFRPAAINVIEDIGERVHFVILSSLVLFFVMLARSYLDYRIGLGIYFPEIYKNEWQEVPSSRAASG